jgi:hypothetical protein
MRIQWSPQVDTAQIYSAGIEMALCSARGEQIGPFVYCKDFFQDAIRGFLNKEKSDIYHYTYTPGKDADIDLDATRILMTNSGDAKFLDKVPAILDFINQFRRNLGVQQTDAVTCDNPPLAYKSCGVAHFIGDRMWMHSSALLSAYTLLLRNGTMHTYGKPYEETLEGIISGKIKPAQQNDKIYLENGKPGIDLILAKGIMSVFGDHMKKNYPSAKQMPTSKIHHFGGIVGFSSGKSREYFPDWEYPTELSKPPAVCFS